MRIYDNPIEAVKEVSRDTYEMGVHVHTATMQDKFIADNPDFDTLEVRGYGFKIVDCRWTINDEQSVVKYFFTGDKTQSSVLSYIDYEHADRTDGIAKNPGNSYRQRETVWNEFLHDGLFAYTYSERMAPQINRILNELRLRPESRQGIINIHTNISPSQSTTFIGDGQPKHDVRESADLQNMGGTGRIPCSMYYQVMIREEKVDLIYTMRSCDLLTHFPVDIMLARRLQTWFADQLHKKVGTFTYFTGSLHAYAKDLKVRGIF